MASASVLLAWLFACLPLLLHGFPHGHDASYELFRIAGYRNALAEGQLPPYWGGGFFVGYGSPIYVFYAPAFMFVSSLVSHLSGSLLTASAWVASGCLGTAAFAAHRSAHAVFDRVEPGLRHQLACVAAITYVLHPYLLGTLYERNALGEFAALCLFPFALWSALLLRDESTRGRRRAILGVSAVLAASVMTHNLSALVAAAFLLGTGATFVVAQDQSHPPGAGGGRTGRLGTLLAGIALGLLLSAWFWIPALGYSELTRTDVELRRGKLDFHNNFVPFLSNFGVVAFYGTGPLMPAALVAGLGRALRMKVRAGLSPVLAYPLVLFSAVLLALQFRVSTPLWEHLPFLALVQFPWRFLGHLGWIGAVCVAILALPLLRRVGETRWPAVQLGTLILVAGQALLPISRVHPLPRDVQRGFDAATTPRAMRNNPGAMETFRWEYIPRHADRDLWKADVTYGGAVHHTLGPLAVQVEHDSPRSIELTVEAPLPTGGTYDSKQMSAAVVFRRWRFPGWTASLDGKPTSVEPSPEGLVAVAVPVGHHRIALTLSAPPLRQVSLPMSIVGALLWVLLYVRSRRD